MKVGRLSQIALIAVTVTFVASCDLLSLIFPNMNPDDALEKPPVTIAYQDWADARAFSHVAEVILEDNGFDVTLEMKDNAQVWSSVADGSADAMLSAWLPDYHADYYGENGQYTDQVEDVGINFYYAISGLVVPSYVNVDSIADLDANAALFNSTITGIGSGSGLNTKTQTAIDNDTNSLGNWTLDSGSSDTMTSALETAINNNEEIVVTGWSPHWMFAEWDLKFLDDPQDIYGGYNDIHTIVRLGLESDNPGAYDFFNSFDWTAIDIQEVMLDVENGESEDVAAENFVDTYQETINAALPNTDYF